MNPGRAARPGGEELLAHGRFLRALARGLVGDGERAEDLVHETLAVAIARPPRDASAPRAWLAQILRRLASSRGRREGERPAREAAAARERVVLDEADPPALLAEIELARRLLEAVEGLREPYRSTLYLRYWRGLAPQRIAAQESLPLKTVKTRLARGLELLRSELDRRPGGREAWVALLLPLARSGRPAPPPDASPMAAPHASSLPVPTLALGGLLLIAGLGAVWVALGKPIPAPVLAQRLESSSPGPGPASVPGGAPQRVEREAAPRTPVPAEAASGVRLTGRVLDPDGHGLPGVDVRALVFASELHASHRPDARVATGTEPLGESTTTSDEHGSFALDLERGGLARVALELDGRAPRSRHLFVVDGQTLALDPFVLELGALLEGTVVDPEGLPVPDAELWLAREDEGLVLGGRAGGPWLAATGRSDARGRFHLTRLASGTWSLEVRAPGFAPARASGPAPWPEAERGPLVLTLEADARLAGEVLGLTPEERGRARVVARPLDAVAGELPPEPLVAALDEHGGFVLTGLARGEECELVVLEGTGVTVRSRSEPLRARAGGDPVQLFARAVREETSPRWAARAVRLAPEELAGRLVTVARASDGTPVPGALVVCREASARPWFAHGEVRASDAEGRVEWTGLAAGEHVFRVVSGIFGPDEGAGAPWSACTLRAAEEAELALTGPERADLSGTVRASGQALPGTRLWLRPAADPAGRGPAAALVSRVDPHGRFAFHGLPVGTYALEIAHPERAQVEQRELLLGEEGAELRIELSEADLSGCVRDERGEPVSGASVRIQAERGEPGFTRTTSPGGGVLTDSQGRFRLVGVDPERPLALVVRAAGRATLQREVRWPAEELELVLAPEVPLTLRLHGTPRPYLVLVAEGPRGERLDFGLSTADTTLHRLGPGPWRLTLRSPRGWAEEPLARLEVELVAGEPRTLTLELP